MYPIVTPLLTKCVLRWSQPFIVGGYAIWAIGLGLLSTLDENTSTAKIIGYQILNGCKCLGLSVRD